MNHGLPPDHKGRVLASHFKIDHIIMQGNLFHCLHSCPYSGLDPRTAAMKLIIFTHKDTRLPRIKYLKIITNTYSLSYSIFSESQPDIYFFK